MINSKIIFLLFLISVSSYGCTFINHTFTPNYTEKQCEQIESNFDQLKNGMDKTEVISLIGKESRYKVYRYPGFFLEQKNEWEIWILCVDSESCIFQQSLGREQCYKWHMIAFDVKTGKLVKVFSDNPERVGFA